MSCADIYLVLVGLLQPQKITLVAHPEEKHNDSPPREKPEQRV